MRKPVSRLDRGPGGPHRRQRPLQGVARPGLPPGRFALRAARGHRRAGRRRGHRAPRGLSVMPYDNPTWRQERIANELLLKLGVRASPRTVRKYMPKRLHPSPSNRVQSQRWSTFIRNHAKGIVACDFCVVVTATFRPLYVFVVIEHASRRLLHVNVTAHPRCGVDPPTALRSDPGRSHIPLPDARPGCDLPSPTRPAYA